MKTRLHDWQSRFAAVIEQWQRQPFARGASDCCRFAGASVEAITGADPLVGWEWTDLESALALLEAHGGMRAAVTEVLGAEVAIGLAQPGDVGFFLDEGDMEGLAVFAGEWLATGRRGLVRLDPDAILAVWRCCGSSDD